MTCITCSLCFSLFLPLPLSGYWGEVLGDIRATVGWCARVFSSEGSSVLSSCWIAEIFADTTCAHSPEISFLIIKAEWGPASVVFKVPQVILVCTQGSGSSISENWPRSYSRERWRGLLSAWRFVRMVLQPEWEGKSSPDPHNYSLYEGFSRRGVSCENRGEKLH